MKNQKIVLVIDTLIKLVVIIALIIAVETKQQYSYFTFLRWLVMATFIYFAYKSYDKKQIGLLIYFGIVAVLFNPVHKFWFQKETWHLINYLVAIITLGIIIFDWTQKEKNKDIKNETKTPIMETKTKIIISKEIVINLKLILVSIGITIIAFGVFYFALKPNKLEIENKIRKGQTEFYTKLREDQNKKNLDLKKVLSEYVVTANNPKYNSDWDIINSKFPELKGYDKYILQDYVATANNFQYNYNWDIINSKFPELFPELKKEKNLAVAIDSNVINTEYEYSITIFKEDLIGKTLLTFYISLIVLIIGRYFYKLAMITGRSIYTLIKAILKYSKMDINEK